MSPQEMVEKAWQNLEKEARAYEEAARNAVSDHVLKERAAAVETAYGRWKDAVGFVTKKPNPRIGRGR